MTVQPIAAAPPVSWRLDLTRGAATIGKVLKFGLFPFAGSLPVPPWRRERFAVRFRRCLEELGLTYLKLGQFLALRFDILPAEICLELNHLFESVDPMPPGEAERTIVRELGAPMEDLFAAFSGRPIAAASVGQVHEARLKDGRRVAVKVQRTGIEAVFRADIRNVRRLAAIAQRLGAFGRMSGTGMVEQFEQWTLREMDFRVEGRTAERVRRNAGPAVVIPTVHWSLTTARVLTMDFIDGVSGARLRDFVATASPAERAARLPGFDFRTALYNFVDAALSQVFADGFFHGDPHPGNILFLPHNRVAFLDFGIFGSLNRRERDVVTGQIEYLAMGDIASSLDYYRRQVIVTEDTNIDRFDMQCTAVLKRWHLALSDAGSSVDDRHLARYSGEMISISRNNGLAYDLNYLLFWRAMNNLNATLWHLDPAYDLIGQLRGFFRRIRPSPLARLRDVLTDRSWRETLAALGRGGIGDAGTGLDGLGDRRPILRLTHAWAPRRERRDARRAIGGAVLLLAPGLALGAPGLDPALRWAIAATVAAALAVAWRRR